MNADQYVAIIVAANPKLFAASKIQISPESLKKHLRRAFQAGQVEGENRVPLFDAIFGKGK